VTNARDLFYWFGFDAMGDFVFSRSFEMLHRKEWHYIVTKLQKALALLGPASPAPWLMHFAFKLFPRVGVLKDWFEMTDWAETEMRERVLKGRNTELFDLVHYLVEEGEQGQRMSTKGEDEDPLSKEDMLWLAGDSLVCIVAGR
jgi:tryprostatin B 6-hydroxylase